MATKKQSIMKRVQSKRYWIAALFSAVAVLAATNPGVLESFLGEQAAAKLVGLAAVFNVLTKELDEKKKSKSE